MRVKKQKRHRRVLLISSLGHQLVGDDEVDRGWANSAIIDLQKSAAISIPAYKLRFYSSCFGFREPYKILFDGTFVHHLLVNDLLPANDALHRLLGSRTLLFTTNCIIGELKSLGKSHAAAFQAANELTVARCDHERRVCAAACIEEVVAKSDGECSNPEHFFVATQDTDLRRKLREVPGIPVIYGVRNTLFLDQLSSKERDYAKYTEERRSLIGDPGDQKLRNRKSTGKSENTTRDLSVEHVSSEGEIAEEHATRNNDLARQKLGVADKAKFKRKKAKGPNPLSCKKKKPKENPSVTQQQNGEQGAAPRCRKSRKRKRTPKVNKLAET